MKEKYRKKVDSKGNEYFEKEVSGLEQANSFGKNLAGCGCLFSILLPVILLILMLF